MDPATLTLRVLPFEALSLLQLYALLQFRQEVFVLEQDCPYVDADGKDPDCLHLWLEDAEGRMAAYCRLVPEGVFYTGYVSIGRVISRHDLRRTGAGRRLMRDALDWIGTHWPGMPVKISAQCYLEDFYGSFGFQGVGDAYLEDNIPHRAMVLGHS
jgi:ElaA protein